MRRLALIPARRDSKGIHRKNWREFCGKPLIEWTVELARDMNSHTFVTTDDERYAHDHPDLTILRPLELGRDDTPMLPVVAHALQDPRVQSWRPDVVLLLQPTSPLRTNAHLRAALDLIEQTGADSVVSVVEIPAHYSPDYACRIGADGVLWRWHPEGFALDNGPVRRQECEKAYSRDGTVYAIRRETIERGSLYGDKCVPLIIPPHESCNIDTEEDWQRAEAMMRERISVDCPCCLGFGSHEEGECSECCHGRMLPHEAEAWKKGARRG